MVNTGYPRFLVDFNRLTPNSEIRTRTERADGPIWGGLAQGGLVVLFDGDGDECLASITAVNGNVINCHAHLDTWLDGPRVVALQPVLQFASSGVIGRPTPTLATAG